MLAQVEVEDEAKSQAPRRLAFVNGDTYAGGVTGNVPCGAGVFVFAGGGGRYEGEVRMACMHVCMDASCLPMA